MVERYIWDTAEISPAGDKFEVMRSDLKRQIADFEFFDTLAEALMYASKRANKTINHVKENK